MRRWGQVELLPFDPEPERTLYQLRKEQRNTSNRSSNHAKWARSGPRAKRAARGQYGNNGRNYAPMSFIQPDDPFMLLKEFALPPTVVQSTIRRPPIQANNFELKTVTLQMLQNIQFYGLPSENPNTHLKNFIKVCDTVK